VPTKQPFDIDKLPIGELFLYQIKILLEKMAVAPGGGGAGGRGWPPNTPTVQTIRVLATLANTAYRCPQMTVPDGFAVVIKADPNNAAGGFIRIGDSSGGATNPNSSWPLVPNESISYYIQDPWNLWYSGTNAGDAAIFTVEKV
jgi:hypothetical protein